MRGHRAKQYRKLMHQYAITFNFREPYQVLCASRMPPVQLVRFAHTQQWTPESYKTPPVSRWILSPVSNGHCKGRSNRVCQQRQASCAFQQCLMYATVVTQCSMRHLYALSSSPQDSAHQAIIALAKNFERRRCNHHTLEQPLSTLECICSVVDPKSSGTNKHRYIIASQDAEVRARMRMIPGVPMVYIKRSVMIMEPMAHATEEVREREERGKFRMGLKSKRGAGGEKRKRETEDDEIVDGEVRNGSSEQVGGPAAEADVQPTQKRRKRGPKGPNPLSIKKAKNRPAQENRTKTEKRAAADDIASDGGISTRGLPVESTANEPAKKKRTRKHKFRSDDKPIDSD